MKEETKLNAIQEIKDKDPQVVIVIDDNGLTFHTDELSPEFVVGCLNRLTHNILNNTGDGNEIGTIGPVDNMPDDPFPEVLLPDAKIF